jgi:3-oxo-5-alpha-steroid 4-dehydrogenase 1
MTQETLELIAYIWMFIALAVHVTMFYIKAPFGRHTSEKWGVSINNKLGWFIMELPSLLIMVYFLFWGKHSFESYAWILFVIWILHYTNRTFIFPLRIKPTPKKMPLFIVMNAILFNFMNAGLNGYFLSEFSTNEQYGNEWLTNPHFISGAILFFTGMVINWKSDTILINLRKKGDTGYKIPYGFLFDYVSSPNLFGEIMEWGGFALMAWNLPALTFFVWTCANLIPRAKNHHDWYHEHFSDYPTKRKVVFPFLY